MSHVRHVFWYLPASVVGGRRGAVDGGGIALARVAGRRVNSHDGPLGFARRKESWNPRAGHIYFREQSALPLLSDPYFP